MRSVVRLLLLFFIMLGACDELSDPQRDPVEPPRAQVEAEQAGVAGQVTASPQPTADFNRITADDPRIRYTGRINFADSARPAFDWPGITIEANFSGPYLAVLIEDGQNSYNITLDGQESVLHTQPGITRYVVAEGLSSGQHSLRMTKRTETYFGTPQFLGFELERGHDLGDPPPAAARRIEFIGDSITAGYGSEGTSPDCTFSKETENVELTYAAMTAAELNADYTTIAISGIGIVRNYYAEEKMSSGTMLAYYDLTTTDPDSPDWDFERWVPDAVVINLGTNDFSTDPQPEGEVFLQGYTELIMKVRNRYPQAHIFAIAGPLMVDPAEAIIRSVVTQMREVLNDQRVHLVQIEDNLELSAADYGCDWHPNASGHRKIAEQLIPRLRQEMNW